MAGLLPHNAQIRADVAAYLQEVLHVTASAVDSAASSHDFTNIYKTCLAVDSILAKLDSRRAKPKLTVARVLVRKVPLLVATGQLNAAYAELRRLIEVVVWCIYFTEHPVEWGVFVADGSRGFTRDIRMPITYCASQSRQFYSDYAAELFTSEPSGMASEAIHSLAVAYANLSGEVHASKIAISKTPHPTSDSLAVKDVANFTRMYRAICANAAIALSAYFIDRFDKMPAMPREWFDWLISQALSRKLRSGRFGLNR